MSIVQLMLSDRRNHAINTAIDHPFQFHNSSSSSLNEIVVAILCVLSSLYRVNKNGKKKTLTISRQCCHGYARPRNAAYATPCEKIDIRDIETTAADMGAKEFVAKAKSSGLADMITSSRNITIFLPLDEVFNTYTDSAQSENVSTNVLLSLCNTMANALIHVPSIHPLFDYLFIL